MQPFASPAHSACSHAQENAIESISANQQGANVIVKIAMKNPLQKPPIGFSITNPARIALDFAGTSKQPEDAVQEVGIGDVRSVNVVQAGERTRLVFNLNRPLNYATAVDGKYRHRHDRRHRRRRPRGQCGRRPGAAGSPVAQAAPAGAPAGKPAIRDIDFRRGTTGEGRVVVDLPNNQVGVDVRQQGQNIVVDFVKTALAGNAAPPPGRRRLRHAGAHRSPPTPQGDNVRMVIEPKGLWEHSAYQSDIAAGGRSASRSRKSRTS